MEAALFLAGAQFLGGIRSSSSIKAEGRVRSAIAEANARMAELQGRQIIKQGNLDAAKFKKNARRILGTQVSSFAANNIDVNSQVALDIKEDTEHIIEMDTMAIKNNAWREAWGLKQEANQFLRQARQSRQASRNASGNTLLSSAIGAGTTLFLTSRSGGKDA